MTHIVIDILLSGWCILTNVWALRQGTIAGKLRKLLMKLADYRVILGEDLEKMQHHYNRSNEHLQKVWSIVLQLEKEIAELKSKQK